MCIHFLYVSSFASLVTLVIFVVERLERPLFSSVFGLHSAQSAQGLSSSLGFGCSAFRSSGLGVQGYPFSSRVTRVQGLRVPLRF